MLIQTRDAFEKARTVLLDADEITIDTETTGLAAWGNDRLVGISTWCEIKGAGAEVGFYFPFRHRPGETLLDMSENLPIEWLQELKPCFEKKNTRYCFHNQKFDAAILLKENIDVVNVDFYDTALLAHMVQSEFSSKKLEDVAQMYLGEGKVTRTSEGKKLNKNKMGEYAPAVVEPYAVKDAYLTHKLWKLLWKKVEEYSMANLWPADREFARMLFAMERFGTRVDIKYASELSVKTQQRMRDIEDELGFDPLKLNELAKRLFLPPPDGLGFTPGDRTKEKMPEFPEGRPVMDEATLSQYKHPITELVLEYRGHVKANSTWYEGFVKAADREQRIHPTFNQNGTRTSRLSCSNPNMQQLPRNVEDTPVRKLLIPTDGFQLVEFDYSQIELRLGAIYAASERMLEAFREGTDVHQLTADAVGLTRYQGKTLNFSIIYGAGAATVADKLGLTFEQAQSVLAEFHSQFPGFKAVAGRAEDAARHRGFIKLWTGRTRAFSDPNTCHKAFNALIQGGAAEIVKRTMLLLWEEYPWQDYFPILQVHDALYFEVREEAAESGCLKWIKDLMEWPTQDFPIPFTVDMKVST